MQPSFLGLKQTSFRSRFVKNFPVQSGEKQLSKASFYQYWPKNYTKGKQLTDLCKICHLIDPSYLKRHPELSEFNQGLVEQHKLIIQDTQECFQKSLDSLSKEKKNAVILFDFKEKFKVGFCKKQIGANFYNQRSVTLLTFCIFYPTSIEVNFINLLNLIFFIYNLFFYRVLLSIQKNFLIFFLMLWLKIVNLLLIAWKNYLN